jgi:hypothetical protein
MFDARAMLIAGMIRLRWAASFQEDRDEDCGRI